MPAHPASKGRTVKILLVEDNPADALFFSQGLKRLRTPTSLQVSESAEEALDYLASRPGPEEAERPHILFVDLNLPGMRGLELIDVLKTREDLRDVPMLVLTSSSAPRDMELARSIEAQAYLVKPILLTDLYLLLEEVERSWLQPLSIPA